jgi:hypothetical protein
MTRETIIKNVVTKHIYLQEGKTVSTQKNRVWTGQKPSTSAKPINNELLGDSLGTAFGAGQEVQSGTTRVIQELQTEFSVPKLLFEILNMGLSLRLASTEEGQSSWSFEPRIGS